MKIGLIGSGSIGQFLLDAVNVKHEVPQARIEWIFDERTGAREKLASLANTYGCHYTDQKNVFLSSNTDIVVECASPDVAKLYAADVVNHGKDMVIISVGALVDNDFLAALASLCEANRRTIYLPSGAIGGLDALGAAKALDGIERVQLTTRKPPDALSLTVNGDQPLVVFSGSAKEAIAKYPKNINVAVTLSLAGLGVDQTRVEILADPRIKRNTHEIWVKGTFGEMRIALENLPMPNNPKTSYLAALSALSTLQRLSRPIKIG